MIGAVARRLLHERGVASGHAENDMLHYAIVFLVIALVAAALGFGALAGVAAFLAKVLFFVFLVLFMASLLYTGLRRV